MTAREVTAEVTAADIFTGTPRSVSGTHPVAMAVRRALGMPAAPHPGCRIFVGESWFSIGAGSFYESYDLPAPAGWIKDYDAGLPVPPFRFTFATRWGAV